MATSKTVFLEVGLWVGFVENDWITVSEQSSFFQFISYPTGCAVTEEKHHTGIGFQDAFVFITDSENEIQILPWRIPFIPFTKVCFDDFISLHSQSWIVGNIVRKISADKIDAVVFQPLHNVKAVPLNDVVDCVFHNHKITQIK
jgi:hypothetical protein